MWVIQMSTSVMVEVAELQSEYSKLLGEGLTKKKLCDLCIPFRDKYNLTDMQVLCIARRELSFDEVIKILG